MKPVALTFILLLGVSLFGKPASAQRGSVPDEEARQNLSSLSVQIRGVQDEKGQVFVMLFNREDGFPSDVATAFRSLSVAPSEGAATVEFAHLPAGPYAVAAFHDADGNGKLNTNWVGMPREGVIVTNYSGGRPKFDESMIEIGAGALRTIDLVLDYR